VSNGNRRCRGVFRGARCRRGRPLARSAVAARAAGAL